MKTIPKNDFTQDEEVNFLDTFLQIGKLLHFKFGKNHPNNRVVKVKSVVDDVVIVMRVIEGQLCRKGEYEIKYRDEIIDIFKGGCLTL